MSNSVISVENLTKQYDLGVIGTGTLSRDLERWWARVRKQPDPFARIGQKDRFEEIGGSILALDDISFTVNQGEALGIIGRNGAGKSTLLKILSRVTAPSSGVVKVKGRIGSLLEVGTGFHPELTGRENVYLNGAILGMRKDEVTRKFDEIVAFSGVERFIDTPVKRYSSGMYVRLAFAVAAHLDPEILIVDEVLAVGDAEFQKKCLGKMGDVASEGRTVLFVSHNMGAINNLCSKCIWINNGRLEEIGETASIIHNYLHSADQRGDVAEIDLTDFPERYGDGQAKLLAARLLNAKDQPDTQFSRNNPFTVEIELESRTISPLILSLVVVNDLGINVLHTTHFDSSDAMEISEPGRYRTRVVIPNLPLFPGSYKLILGIHTTTMMLPADVVKNVLPFSVSEPLDSPRPIKTPSSMFMSWTPSEWKAEPISND
jgi:lipopolysaccharide transport system ATP-binding protein